MKNKSTLSAAETIQAIESSVAHALEAEASSSVEQTVLDEAQQDEVSGGVACPPPSQPIGLIYRPEPL